MVLSELGADLLFTQIKIGGRKSSFVNLSREHASDLDKHSKTDWRKVPLSAVFEIRESPTLRKQGWQATVFRVNIAYYARVVGSHLKIFLLSSA